MMGTRFGFVSLAFLVSVSAWADKPYEALTISGETDRPALAYAPGETMTFTLRLSSTEGLPAGSTIAWLRTGDDGVRETGSVPVSSDPVTVKTSLDRPGFVWLRAVVKGPDGKELKKDLKHWDHDMTRIAFNGGAGVEPEKLTSVPEPDDFDAFWERQLARLKKTPLESHRIEVTPEWRKDVRVWAVEVACAGIRPVTGYMSVPRDAEKGKKYPVHLSLDGYGYYIPKGGWAGGAGDEIHLHINAHGMKLPEFGADDGYYKVLKQEIAYKGEGYAFSAEQNKDPETAYFNGMALRVLRALEFLRAEPGWNGKDVIVTGESQGGLQTVWAAALDPTVTRAESGITWGCDIGGTELGRNRGGWYLKWVPELGYYDCVNMARRIRPTCTFVIPRAGLGDYTCPPSGVTILYNNVKGPKKITYVQGSTHGYVPKDPTNPSYTFESTGKED